MTKQKTKQLQFTASIAQHDYEVKVKAAQRFLEKSYQVKVVLRLFGREQSRPDVAFSVLERLANDLISCGVAQTPKQTGRNIVMFVFPKRKKSHGVPDL